jgi:hypothetical protein
MVQRNLITTDAAGTTDVVGPIQNPDARRVCSLAGIETERQKLFTLRQLRDGLDMAIRELENQGREEKSRNRYMLVLRFTKATCDAFISMAGALVGGSAEKVSEGYAALTPVAEAVGTSAAGGKVDLVKAGATFVKEGVPLVTHNKGKEILTKYTVVKVEVIKGALNHDDDGIIKSARDYSIDLGTIIADSEEFGVKGKVLAAFAKVAKSAFEYNEQIGKAFDQLSADDIESQERVYTLRSNLVHQAKLLSKKIDEMEQFVTSCEYQLYPRKLP